MYFPPLVNALTYLAWENGFVVNIGLYPRHELLNVGRGGHLGRTLIVLVVLPKIFESADVSLGVLYCLSLVVLLVSRLHLGARMRRAELGNGTVEQIDLVVKVHH